MEPKEPGHPTAAVGRQGASAPGDGGDVPAGPDHKPDLRLGAYVAALAAFALALLASLLYRYGADWGPGFVFGAAVAAAVLLLADALPLRVSERHEINAADVGLLTWYSSLPTRYPCG